MNESKILEALKYLEKGISLLKESVQKPNNVRITGLWTSGRQGIEYWEGDNKPILIAFHEGEAGVDDLDEFITVVYDTLSRVPYSRMEQSIEVVTNLEVNVVRDKFKPVENICKIIYVEELNPEKIDNGLTQMEERHNALYYMSKHRPEQAGDPS